MSKVEAQIRVSYELGECSGRSYIKCSQCNRVSFHPQDIKERYCGGCRQFFDDQLQLKEAS